MCVCACACICILKTQDVEVGDIQNNNTIEFLKFIPTISCYSPKDALSHNPLKKSNKHDNNLASKLLHVFS